jgi:acetyltransferase-like isoleucine patch superfamily enzyme
MYPISLTKALDALRYRVEFPWGELKWRLLGLRLGRRPKLYRHIVIHDVASVVVGDDCNIGPFTLIFGAGGVTIGRDVLISSHCSIFSVTHRVDAGREQLRYRETVQAGPVVLGDNVWIGTGVRILPGVTIGANTVVGSGSVVTKSLPPGVVAFGVPAKVVRPVALPPAAP